MRIFLFLMPLIVFAANLHIQVNKTKILPNEEVLITLTAKGKEIEFPNPSKIAGYPVLGTSINNNIMVINGEVKESVSKTFVIAPDKNITIPSFNVKIDGKIYKTKPVKIEVVSPKQTKGDYELDLNISKKNLYIGESAILRIKFTKQKNIDTVQIQSPENENFYLKEISKQNLPNGVEYDFLIIPQKAGDFTIGPISAKIGHLIKEKLFGDPFFTMTSMKYQTIYSNKLNIKVKPIPKDSVFGDFNISVKANNVVEANKPNNVYLKLSGCGDFLDMKEFDLKIKNASVYKNIPSLKTYIKNQKLCGTLEQNFTVISDTNYTIGAFKLKEFNGTSLKTISSKPINVYVKGGAVKKTTPPPIKQQKSQNSNKIIFIAFIIGMVIGGTLVYLIFKINLNRQADIYQKIKKANQKELFNLLIPYSNIPEIKEILLKLEDNIYKNANHKINKKEIIKIFKNLKED